MKAWRLPAIRAKAAALLATALAVALRVYQIGISPLLGQHCRFHPTCSRYAIAALRQHGPWRGALLAARRLSRCHPWHPGGVDFVPASASAANGKRNEG